MKIEGLHNNTGRWIDIAVDLSEDDFDEAQQQIHELARGCASVIILWGAPVKVEDFSAFRVST